jgi:hypothetical protein
LPHLDKQIDILKAKLEEVDYAELNADQILNEIFTPQNAIDKKILHYQCKDEAFQSTLLGFKSGDVNNLSGWLQHIR